MDKQTVEKAADHYVTQNRLTVVPATGTGSDRFEQTLVEVRLLATTATYFDLADDGSVTHR